VIHANPGVNMRTVCVQQDGSMSGLLQCGDAIWPGFPK